MKEEQILKSVFWPENKKEILGNLVFSHTDEDITNTQENSVSRQANAWEVFFYKAPVFNPENREYFVKMYFEKNTDNELVVNKEKTSPELKTDSDIEKTLEIINTNIALMNTKPQFFSTGVAKSEPALKKII